MQPIFLTSAPSCGMMETQKEFPGGTVMTSAKTRLFLISLAALLCLAPVLSACGTGGDVIPDVSAKEVVSDVVSDYSLENGFLFSSDSAEEGEYLDEDLISTYYGDGDKVPDFSKVENYCVYIDESDARVMCEIGLFRFSEGADMQTFESFLKNRIAVRLSNAKSYPDIDKSTLKGAQFAVVGNYVYYVVVKGASAEIARRIDLLLHERNQEA